MKTNRVDKVVVRLRYTFDAAAQETVLQQLIRTTEYYWSDDPHNPSPLTESRSEEWENVDFEY